MSIFDRMKDITAGKTTKALEEETKAEVISKRAKHGDVITGNITNLVPGNEKKKGGYGFIASTELPYERIFFHWSGLVQDTLRYPDLKKRMKVEFQLQHDEFNGYRAIKIRVIE